MVILDHHSVVDQLHDENQQDLDPKVVGTSWYKGRNELAEADFVGLAEELDSPTVILTVVIAPMLFPVHFLPEKIIEDEIGAPFEHKPDKARQEEPPCHQHSTYPEACPLFLEVA